MLIFLGKRVTPSTSNRRLDVDGTFVNKQKADFNGRKRAFLSPRCAGFKFYRDARGGADVDDRACPTLNEGRSGGVGEASEGGDVESDHVFHLPDVGLKQWGDGSKAGVVDEHGDTRIVPPFCFHFRQIRVVVEVRHDGSDLPSARA